MTVSFHNSSASAEANKNISSKSTVDIPNFSVTSIQSKTDQSLIEVIFDRVSGTSLGLYEVRMQHSTGNSSITLVLREQSK